MTKSPAQVSAVFGCTPEQARAQMLRNAAGLERTADTMGKRRKVNGFTAQELRERAANYRKAVA